MTGTLTVHYTDGTSAELPITVVAAWCGAPAEGSTTVLAMPHRIRAGSGVDGPPVKLFGLALPLDATKTVRPFPSPPTSASTSMRSPSPDPNREPVD